MAFLTSLFLGLLYSALIGLISRALWSAFIVWPVITLLLWITFWKFNLLRFSAYLAVLPLSILVFEIVRSLMHPATYAFRYLSLDRSHYTPGVRIVGSQTGISPEPGHYGRGAKEILIGKDGFRADPDTGQGNPERCGLALIGDSMIYGSGLSYSETLRPVLAAMGADACVFGVTGNAPIDYLSTLKHVAKRIEKGAHIAIYLYTYNDFIKLNKYMRRHFRASSNSFELVAGFIAYADDWRRTTFTYKLFGTKSNVPPSQWPLWQIKLGETKTLEFYSRHDPARYVPPPPLNEQQRVSLKFSLQELRNFVHDQSWRVSLVILPDNDEVMGNLARQAVALQALDPRRADALAICRTFPFGCEDITTYLYERTLAEGKNLYFMDNRHFSAFGTRVVAEHFMTVTKRLGQSPRDYTRNLQPGSERKASTRE